MSARVTTSTLARQIAARVRAFCEANADPAIVGKYSRYFVEGYDAYGLDHRKAEWVASRQEWLAQLKQAGPAELLDACETLVRPGKYEEVFTAIFFAAESPELYSPEFFARVGRWFEQGIANWAEVDTMASRILGPFLAGGFVELQAFQPWVESPFKYQRRSVPVTLIGELKRQKDFKPLFRLVEPLMADGEKVVHQGMGWFLREAWKKQPEPAEAYLLRFKDTCPRLIVQYATEKMDVAARQKFKRQR